MLSFLKWMLQMSGSQAAVPNRSLGGLDILRLGTVLLVTAQHVLTLYDLDQWTKFFSLNIGQLGVALFLGVSGLLGSMSQRPPVAWLLQRLRRIYPAYWLAMLFSFALAALTKYKTFGIGQFLSQMLGLGLFTHPDNLVNNPTWFISLLLVCYVALFFARLSKLPLSVDLIFVAAIVAWGVHADFPYPAMHLLTFFAASLLTVALPTDYRMRGLIGAGIFFLLLAPISVAFAYTGIPLLLIGLLAGLSAVPRAIGKIAEYSYEYYLIHGIFLYGTISALRTCPALAIPSGILLSCVAAVCLHRAASYAVRQFEGLTGKL